MNCNQQGCEEPAEFEYVWPSDGQTKRSCGPHAKKAEQVLAVLGFGVVMHPLTAEQATEERAE